MSLRRDLEAHGQEHLLRHLEELNEEEKACLYRDLTELDLPRISTLWQGTQSTMAQCSQIKDDKLQPLDPSIIGSTLRDKELLETWRNIGIHSSLVCSRSIFQFIEHAYCVCVKCELKLAM